MTVLIVLGLMVVVSIVLSVMPRPIYNLLTKVFSFENNGVRHIRRRNDNVDTLANICLFMSVLFSLVYFVVPLYSVIYAIFLILSLLCVLGQANRVMKKATNSSRIVVFFGLSLMAMIGLVSSTGWLNGHVSDMLVITFRNDLFAGKVFDIFYLLTNHSIIVYILQGILFFIPMYCMWSQFKYMRLEKTYKAYNLITFVIKVLFICGIMMFISIKGFDFINFIYQVEYKEA